MLLKVFLARQYAMRTAKAFQTELVTNVDCGHGKVVVYSHHSTHAPLVLLFSSYNVTIQFALKAHGRKRPQNSHPITVFYDGWAIRECIVYWQQMLRSALQAIEKK